MKIKWDIGDGAVSLDIGPLSVILGDLAGRWGARLCWYRKEWAYCLEVSTSRIAILEERA